MIAVLSRKRPHAAFGYLATTVLVLAVQLAETATRPELHRYLPFVPVIVLAALVFGRGTGFYATLLSAAVADWSYAVTCSCLPLGWSSAVLLLVFLVVGIGMSALMEELCRAVRKLSLADAEKALLLDELVHRTRNDLMMIASVLDLQAMREDDPHVRAALDSAVARVRVIAAAQERLRNSGKQGQVELSGYLKALGNGLGDLLRDVRPITVEVHAATMWVDASVAVSMGLIMNEWVTNAFKYAFPDEQGGAVRVDLDRTDHGMTLAVQDDGVGCPLGKGNGLGTRLVQMLAARLGGTLERPPATRGCHLRVRLPIKPGEAPDAPMRELA